MERYNKLGREGKSYKKKQNKQVSRNESIGSPVRTDTHTDFSSFIYYTHTHHSTDINTHLYSHPHSSHTLAPRLRPAHIHTHPLDILAEGLAETGSQDLKLDVRVGATVFEVHQPGQSCYITLQRELVSIKR